MPQAKQKFFDPTIFQKCWRGVGEQPTFAKQMKLYSEMKQKSKRESKESQLPSKSEGCNERTRFQGQLRFPRQAGDVPQPCRTGFGRIFHAQDFQSRAAGKQKVFCSSNFSKMLARFRASSPDRCPQAAKSPCHPSGTRSGW